jgi:hypothetical protein
MRIKIEKISGAIGTELSKLNDVALVAVSNADESDIYDPYFVLNIDVYCFEKMPTVEQRRPCYKDVWAFESSLCATRDMFLVDNVAVTVEYKLCSILEDMLTHEEDENNLYRQGETYTLFRIKNSKFLYQSEGWGDKIREKLNALSPIFWQMLQISLLSQMEHSYGDLRSALFKDDSLYFSLSLADFIRCYSAMLFAVNEEFEPGPRYLSREVFNLEIKPEHFETEFKYLFSTNENSNHRKVEVAKLLVESIAPMV